MLLQLADDLHDIPKPELEPLAHCAHPASCTYTTDAAQLTLFFVPMFTNRGARTRLPRRPPLTAGQSLSDGRIWFPSRSAVATSSSRSRSGRPYSGPQVGPTCGSGA